MELIVNDTEQILNGLSGKVQELSEFSMQEIPRNIFLCGLVLHVAYGLIRQ